MHTARSLLATCWLISAASWTPELRGPGTAAHGFVGPMICFMDREILLMPTVESERRCTEVCDIHLRTVAPFKFPNFDFSDVPLGKHRVWLCFLNIIASSKSENFASPYMRFESATQLTISSIKRFPIGDRYHHSY